MGLGELVGSIIKQRIETIPKKKDFASAIVLGHQSEIKVIAEIKPISPTEGELANISESIEDIVIAYESGGATGISVLIEPMHFGGSIELLKTIRDITDLPLLAKGFIISPYHLAQCAVAGADAFLQMVRVNYTINLDLQKMIELGRSLGLEAVVEGITRDEIERAITANAKIIGINCRNIYTDLSINYSNITLGQGIPEHIGLISASGIHNERDLQTVYNMSDGRIDAILVGTSLMRSDNPELAVRRLVVAGKRLVAERRGG